MKISHLFLPVVVLFTTFALGQTSGVIVYNETLNLGVPVERQWTLYFDNKKSIYLETNSTKDDKKKDSNKDSNKIIIDLNVKEFYVASLNTRTLKSQGTVATTPYLIEESIPKIKWELVKESKTINSFDCQKAKGNFRGRTYIAWFTKDIPSWCGPWKLFGLPGGILEFQDETGQIKSSAIQVKINDNIDVDKIIDSNKGNGKSLSIKDYVELKQRENELMLKYAMAKLGREADIRSVEPYKRQGFELKYEWEEE